MKAPYLKLALMGFATASASFWVSACSISTEPEDCGYQAYYTQPKEAGEIEMIISRVTAEMMNGERNCGFGYIQTKVDKPQVNGSDLREVVREEFNRENYSYIAPAGFDPERDILSIESGPIEYTSDPKLVKKMDDRRYVPLKRK